MPGCWPCWGWSALQLLPLPGVLLGWLSPRLHELLPLWSSDAPTAAALGRWSTVSLVPAETRSSLVVMLTYGLLFCVAVQYLRTVERVERLLRWVAWSAVVLAIVGLLQYFLGNGRYLWIYEHPYRTTHGVVLGPFANPNHFAHFLALGVGPLVWLLQRSIQAHREARRLAGKWLACESAAASWALWWHVFALGIVLLAGLLTYSRSGVAMMFLAAAVSAGLMYHAGLLGRRMLRVLAMIFLMIGVTLAAHGYQRDCERLGDYAGGSLEKLIKNGARSKIWRADVRALGDFWMLGSGMGSHREVYPRYFTDPRSIEFKHVENGYLQVALESGLAGLAVLLGGMLCCFSCCAAALQAAAVGADVRLRDGRRGGFSGERLSFDFRFCLVCARGDGGHRAVGRVRGAAWPGLRSTPRRRPRAGNGRSRAAAWPWLPWRWRLSGLGWWMSAAGPRWPRPIGKPTCGPLWPIAARLPPYRTRPPFERLEQIVAWTPADARAHLRLAAARLAHFEQLPKHSAIAPALERLRVAGPETSSNPTGQPGWSSAGLSPEQAANLLSAYDHAAEGRGALPVGRGSLRLPGRLEFPARRPGRQGGPAATSLDRAAARSAGALGRGG